MGWLYAEQARACIARDRLWQAERMVARMRDQALALACLRYGLPAPQGVGIDGLPESVLAGYADCLARTIDAAELQRAFRALVRQLLTELEALDDELHERIAATVLNLAETCTGS